MPGSSNFIVGTAGWAIPPLARDRFFSSDEVKPDHLKAYSATFTGVEINSSFHRDHQSKTYERWAQSTPPSFRFSIKLAKRFTHQQRLVVDTSDLSQVIQGISHLQEKLGALLVQIPPKLSFDSQVSEDFFASLRELYTGPVAFEPRHESWTTREATLILEDYHIARVIADPDVLGPCPPIKSAGFQYFRLHGAPKTYYSDYSTEEIQRWADRIIKARQMIGSDVKTSDGPVWCIFDNTALGHATLNAIQMMEFLSQGKGL